MLLNTAVFAVIAADHMVEAVTASKGLNGGAGFGILPPLSPSVSSSLDPIFRLSLLAVSLLLTLRLGRVYERWWAARRAFSALGSSGLAIARAVSTWVGAADPRAAAVARWAAVFQWSVYEAVTDAAGLHPAAAAVLTPAERAAYAASPKGRQLAILQLTRLLDEIAPTGPQPGDDGSSASSRLAAASQARAAASADLLSRALAAQGECTSIHYQSLPYALTLACTGYVELFMLLYPLSALTRSNAGRGGDAHDPSVASTAFTLAVQLLLYVFVQLLFLGAEEVANTLEDPFNGHLPLEELAKTTIRDVARLPREAAALAALHLGDGGGGGGGGGGVGGSGERAAAWAGQDWGPAVAMCAKREVG